MWNSFQHGGDPVILHMNGVMCNGAGAFLPVLWTHRVTRLMPALCLWNTLFGRRKQDVRNVQFLTQTTNSSLAGCPWKCESKLHLPLWNSIQRVFALTVLHTSMSVHVCLCTFTMSSQLGSGYEFSLLFLPSGQSLTADHLSYHNT